MLFCKGGSSVIWPSKDIFVSASSLGRGRYHYICLLQDDVNETFLFLAHIKGGRAQFRGSCGYFLLLCPSHQLVPCFFILEGPFFVCHWCPTFLCDWCETDISCHQGERILSNCSTKDRRRRWIDCERKKI